MSLIEVEDEVLKDFEQKRLESTDERDRIQKKTFTKWVNKHLQKSGRNVDDLFVDLQNGRNLIALLEALTSETLPKEHGETRFHRTQNVQACLDFLNRRHIKLVNIRPKDIVEGNGKLTLGLIWTIILNFQVSVINQRRKEERKLITQQQQHTITTTRVHGTEVQSVEVDSRSSSRATEENLSAREALLQWARRATAGYPNVNVTNFGSSWRDGLAFNAILHRYRPASVNWQRVSDRYVSARERLHSAFETAEREFGISALLDPEDVDTNHPDEKSIITYVSSLYNGLPNLDSVIQSSSHELDDLASRIRRLIGLINEKLDRILERIESVERRIDTERPEILVREIRTIVNDLDDLGPPIKSLFEDVQHLKERNHPEADDLQREVVGLEQRRQAYLDRINNVLLPRLNARMDGMRNRGNAFDKLNEAQKWVDQKTDELNGMRFVENLETLEEMFEKHKVDNRDIQDFRQTVDECIARQAEVSVDESHEYCQLLSKLESTYQQLRDLSAGRMLDLDSLIAFIRAAQQELFWIAERETIEVARNWSDVNQLDLPMLQNYYKQLLHEIEIRERQFNEVHNQGAALINQRHPASDVIDVYLRSMQNQWDWLLGLSKCLEGHLRDALNVKNFMEESEQIEQWMQRQTEHLEKNYLRQDFTVEEGEVYLGELFEIEEFIRKYQSALLSLAERAADISPLWQRGEQISRPITVTTWCDYNKDGINIATNDEVTLLHNSDLINWQIRDVSGREGQVPSVVFRIPPPDSRIATHLERLRQQLDRLRKLWERKNHHIRYHMLLNTMRQVRGWDLETFLNIPPEQRDVIIRAVNDDANRLLSEMDPNDPLAKRLAEELRLTNEHIANLLRQANKPKEPDHSSRFDQLINDLLRKLDDAWRLLNERVGEGVPRSLDDLERLIHAHKQFEDDLQALDVDVSNVKELFRQIPNPTPTQHANHDHLNARWEDLWDLSRMYVDRLKALESVLQGLDEVTDIVKRHEITLNSFDDLPAALDRLRGVHAQLLELNMVLKQQQNIVDSLNRNVAVLRQHVSRTRFNNANHPDVDRLEDQVQQITVRWENVCAQIEERLKSAEEAQQTQMIYRSQYDEEIQWLDRVEQTINSLRHPDKLRPDQLQAQLDQLVHEYQQLQEHTTTIENINREGGKFIREARTYDIRLGQFHDNVINIHGPSIRSQFRRSEPQPKNGAQIVTEELEALNRRFAELSSLILERKTLVNTYIENHRRKMQEEEERRLAEEAAERRRFEAARRKALDDADRLRREREAAEAERRRRDEEERLRRQRDADEAARRAREDAERRRREEEERRRREEEERRRREEEDRRRREEEERRRRIPDGQHEEPLSDLAQQAYRHLDFVESEQKRGSRAFDQSWNESNTTDHVDDISVDRDHTSQSTSSRSASPERNDIQTSTHEIQTQSPRMESHEVQTKSEFKEQSPVPKVVVSSAETSTEMSTQEIETQVEAKQFHEQSCQSDDLPAPEPAQLEPQIDRSAELLKQFVEAQKALLNWLEETEELVGNQKPPSADPKVVRAQLQNHDFQMKLIDDKQESVSKFMQMYSEVIKLVHETERPQVQKIGKEIHGRYSSLVDGACGRQQSLLDVQNLANEFARITQPLNKWLDDAGAEVTLLCKVVTSNDEIERNLEKQETLQHEIDSKRPDFDDAVHIGGELSKLVGGEDANEVETKVRHLTSRYDELGRRCVLCGRALHGFSEDMRNFLSNTDELAEWLDQIEQEFNRLEQLPLDPQELVSLSEEFAELANAISERSYSVSQIVHESREICTHTSGSEALAMSARIDRLHARYNQLLTESMRRIEDFATAISTAEGMAENVEFLDDFLDTCDDALATLEESLIDDQLERVNGLNEEAEQTRTETIEQTHQLDRWSMWLTDLAAQLSSTKPVGALPETVAIQLADLRLLVDEVEQKSVGLERSLTEARERLNVAEMDEEHTWLKERVEKMEKQWTEVQDRLAAREQQLKTAEVDAIELAERIQAMVNWVTEAENALAVLAPISRIPDTIRQQLRDHKSFLEMSQQESAEMVELSNRGLKVQMTCEKKDTIPIKNQLVSLRHRNDRIAQRAVEREKQMQLALREVEDHNAALADLADWTGKQNAQLDAKNVEPATAERIREQLAEHRDLQSEVQKRQAEYETIYADGRQLVDRAPNNEKKEMSRQIEKLRESWTTLTDKVLKRARSLDNALVQSGKFDEALSQLLLWLDGVLPPIESELNDGRMHGDSDSLQMLIGENERLADELRARGSGLKVVRKRADDILNAKSAEAADADCVDVRAKIDRLNDEWQRLESAVQQKTEKLTDALAEGVEYCESAHELRELCNDFELRCRRETQAQGSVDQTDVAAAQQNAIEHLCSDFEAQRPALQRFVQLAVDVESRAHPRAVDAVLDLRTTTEARWDQVATMLNDRSATAVKQHELLRNHDQGLTEMTELVAKQREQLEKTITECALTETLPEIQNLVIQHAEFKDQLREKQSQMDELMRVAKRTHPTASSTHSTSPHSPTGDLRSSPSATSLNKSTTSLVGTVNAKRPGTAGGSPTKSRIYGEKQILTKRQRRTDQLNEAWTALWTDTVSTEDRLKERRADIEEMRRLENFTFAEWRERYLAWNDSAKARISDLFRRIDKHGAGFVPRRQFIDGVLSSRFPTTRLEMEKVANEFDKNGQISSKEFMNALRYEGRNRRFLNQQTPNTTRNDPERIHNEIKRETARCQCAHSFKITRDDSTKTGTVRYAFGESSIKRMVRILHSTVMVRVGGGWVELAGFLQKHDPCRAKGRTNLELYQNQEFMPGITPAGGCRSNGHIFTQNFGCQLGFASTTTNCRIREKTERSIPMFKRPASRESRSGSTTRVYSRQSSDVSIKIDGSRIPRPSSSNNLAVSRPSSRASDVSELSTTPSRIPSIRGRKGALNNNGGSSSRASSARQSPMLR
ncbi:GAR domain-containing protein [Aphelenchoides besseyi]|nr:GAR domain-containing protein [Aphelenchoides besseyi]